MNLSQIKELALKEKIDIFPFVEKVNSARSKHPSGTDMDIPAKVIPALIGYCDLHKIPIYHVCEDCCSVAATYLDLYLHEETR